MSLSYPYTYICLVSATCFYCLCTAVLSFPLSYHAFLLVKQYAPGRGTDEASARFDGRSPRHRPRPVPAQHRLHRQRQGPKGAAPAPGPIPNPNPTSAALVLKPLRSAGRSSAPAAGLAAQPRGISFYDRSLPFVPSLPELLPQISLLASQTSSLGEQLQDLNRESKGTCCVPPSLPFPRRRPSDPR